jgi:hypothetical protein
MKILSAPSLYQLNLRVWQTELSKCPLAGSDSRAHRVLVPVEHE